MIPPSRTVWIGDLEGFEDENYFMRIFSPIGKFDNFKIFKEQNSKNFYAFIDFESLS